jgi:peptidoglycan/xylan/chitin deacetylase (PgdA/CDA1 family)
MSSHMSGKHFKSSIRNMAAWAYYLVKMPLIHHRGKVMILLYHRVLSEPDLKQHFVQPGMYVLNDIFEKQIRFLIERFQIISFQDFLSFRESKTLDRSQRYCVITFDDGWLDNYLYAYPILKKYKIPATIFLTTAFIGTRHWFWPDKLGYLLRHYALVGALEEQNEYIRDISSRYSWLAKFTEKPCIEQIDSNIEMCKTLPDEEIDKCIETIREGLGLQSPDERILLNWEEIQDMSQHGISFGSHSCTHRILTKLPSGEIRKEIETSLHILREKTINHIPVFCYPNGDCNGEIIQLVKTAGYEAAVGNRFGYEDDSPQDLWKLRRIGIHNDITATIPLLVFHISGLRHP